MRGRQDVSNDETRRAGLAIMYENFALRLIVDIRSSIA
jgi:hypothetical protein